MQLAASCLGPVQAARKEQQPAGLAGPAGPGNSTQAQLDIDVHPIRRRQPSYFLEAQHQQLAELQACMPFRGAGGKAQLADGSTGPKAAAHQGGLD